MRKIICESCAAHIEVPLPPEDVEAGYVQRLIKLRLKKPADHHMTIGVVGGVRERINIPILVCDLCNSQLPDGTIGWAWTMHLQHQKVEAWEQEFGTPEP